MAYNSLIPQANDKFSQSQQQILENFSQLAAAFMENHVALATAGQGKHTNVVMVEQSGDPGTAANEGALYTKEVSTKTHLFYQGESAATPIDLSLVSLPAANKGYFYLPNDLVVQWGNLTWLAGGSLVQTGAFNIPFGAAPYMVMLTPTYNNTSQQDYALQWNVTGTTATDLSFAAYRRTSSSGAKSSVAAPFMYLAIGTR